VPSWVKRYTAGLTLTGAAILVAMGLRPRLGGQTPLTPFTVAVILSAAYGGAGPGILATAIGAGVVYLLFGGDVISLFPGGQPRIEQFLLVGVLATVVIERFRRANAELNRAKANLESANQELSRRSEAVAKSNRALARSNEELQRFAYALSHDLQTPLRTVRMFAERLVANQPADDDTRASVRFIGEGVENMQAMIHGLLEYATASHDEGPRGTADLSAVIRTVLQDLHSQIEETSAVIAADTLPTVDGDETKLRQLFQNLISNAIKYRGERTPEVRISAAAQGREWMFSVKDNGIGIDMRHAERIFGLFERLHPNAEYRGSGIGLAVCRAIVEGHGGRIWVESEVGAGSRFCFTLPAGAAK
jgi:histidine kinase